MQDSTTHDPTTGNPLAPDRSVHDSTIQASGARRPEVRDTGDRDRDPEEIRRDIRQTRGDMDRTVDELVDRFSVGSLVDEAWQRMRRSGGGGPDVGGMFREHPVPIALMGLGLGWLAVEQASGRSVSTDSFGSDGKSDSNGRSTRFPDQNRSWNEGGNGQSQGTDRSGTGGSSEDESLTERVSDRASDAMSTAREKATDMKEKAAGMKESTKAAGARTRAGFHDLLEESPLTVGSIVFGLGLASGLAMPSSDLEDREMGEVSDRIKNRAGELGSRAAKRAGVIGHEVADTAMSEAQHQVEDLRDDLQGGEQGGGSPRT